MGTASSLCLPLPELFWVKTRTGQGLGIPISRCSYCRVADIPGQGKLSGYLHCSVPGLAVWLFSEDPQLYSRSIPEAQTIYTRAEVLCKQQQWSGVSDAATIQLCGDCFNGDPLRWFPQWVCLALKAHRDPLKCRLRHPCPMALLSTQHRGVGRPPRRLRRAVVEWGASCVMWDGGPQHLCPLPSPPPHWKGFCPQGPGNCRPVTGGTVG